MHFEAAHVSGGGTAKPRLLPLPLITLDANSPAGSSKVFNLPHDRRVSSNIFLHSHLPRITAFMLADRLLFALVSLQMNWRGEQTLEACARLLKCQMKAERDGGSFHFNAQTTRQDWKVWMWSELTHSESQLQVSGVTQVVFMGSTQNIQLTSTRAHHAPKRKTVFDLSWSWHHFFVVSVSHL